MNNPEFGDNPGPDKILGLRTLGYLNNKIYQQRAYIEYVTDRVRWVPPLGIISSTLFTNDYEIAKFGVAWALTNAVYSAGRGIYHWWGNSSPNSN